MLQDKEVPSRKDSGVSDDMELVPDSSSGVFATNVASDDNDALTSCFEMYYKMSIY